MKKNSKHGYHGPSLKSNFLKKYFSDPKENINLWKERVKVLNKLYLPITEHFEVIDKFLKIFIDYSNLRLLNFIGDSPSIKAYENNPYSIIPKQETKEWFKKIISS